MSGASSSNDLLVTGHHRSYVSQSALAEIIKQIREHGLPDAGSRSSIKRARERALPQQTPIGAMWISANVEMNNGAQKAFPMVNPLPLLHQLLTECEGFAAAFHAKLQKRGCARESPWEVAIYSDEVLPGIL